MSFLNGQLMGTVVAMLLLGVVASQPLIAQEPSAVATPSAVELIQQLGAPRYSERIAAERQLKQQGLSAFDALREGVEHSDLQIAATSRRLLAQVANDRHDSHDPLIVQRYLAVYDQMASKNRLETLERFARIPEQKGVDPLCLML